MKIKVFFSIVFIMACLSCERDSIDLSRTRLDFGTEGGQGYLSAKSVWGFSEGGEFISGVWNSGNAKITSEKDSEYDYLEDIWVSATLTKATGDIVVSVAPNENTGYREYEFTVWRGNVRAFIKITQKGKP